MSGDPEPAAQPAQVPCSQPELLRYFLRLGALVILLVRARLPEQLLIAAAGLIGLAIRGAAR